LGKKYTRPKPNQPVHLQGISSDLKPYLNEAYNYIADVSEKLID
jgi:hypothetical protein